MWSTIKLQHVRDQTLWIFFSTIHCSQKVFTLRCSKNHILLKDLILLYNPHTLKLSQFEYCTETWLPNLIIRSNISSIFYVLMHMEFVKLYGILINYSLYIQCEPLCLIESPTSQIFPPNVFSKLFLFPCAVVLSTFNKLGMFLFNSFIHFLQSNDNKEPSVILISCTLNVAFKMSWPSHLNKFSWQYLVNQCQYSEFYFTYNGQINHLSFSYFCYV